MVFKFFMVSICDYTVTFRGLFSCISLKIGRDISCLSVACLKFHCVSDIRWFMFTDIIYGVSDWTGAGDLVCVICYVDSLLIVLVYLGYGSRYDVIGALGSLLVYEVLVVWVVQFLVILLVFYFLLGGWWACIIPCWTDSLWGPWIWPNANADWWWWLFFNFLADIFLFGVKCLERMEP